jgi:uncharacterized protein DUF4296
MQKYIILFFSVSLFLFSCNSDKNSGNIIKRDKMTSLLTEIHIIDGSMYSLDPSPDTLYKYGTGRYLALFKRYHTDSVQFKASLKYYTSQTQELQAMYDQVMKNLQKKTDSLNKIQQPRLPQPQTQPPNIQHPGMPHPLRPQSQVKQPN